MKMPNGREPISKKIQYVIGAFVVVFIGIPLIVGIYLSGQDGILTQSAAESVCQRDATIKMQGTSIEVVNVMNYNPQFYKDGDTASNGTPEYMLSWNGRTSDKQNSSQFVCLVSGTKLHPHIDSLQYGADRLE